MKPVTETLLNQLTQSLRHHIPEAQAVYVFGSQATGTENPDSDLDIAVLAPAPLDAEKLFALAAELATAAGRHVDLVDLRAASTVMRSQVIANGRRIYRGDETVCDQFEDLAYSSYARLNEERRPIIEDIQARGRIHD